MTSGFVLVILTMMDSGGMSAAFINTETHDKCEMRGKAVKSILLEGDVDIRTMKCVNSDIKFKKFSHKDAKKAPRHRYVVTLSDNALAVVRMEDVQTCKEAASKSDTSFCATSTQLLVE